MSGAWKAGDVVEIGYPFCRTTYAEWDEDGCHNVPSWRPGVEYVEVGPEGQTEAIAHGIGKQVLEVIDVHKPGRYPTRVFYTCKWTTPDGKPFGKGDLKITTVPAFTRRTRGFMSHDPFFAMRIKEIEAQS